MSRSNRRNDGNDWLNMLDSTEANLKYYCAPDCSSHSRRIIGRIHALRKALFLKPHAAIPSAVHPQHHDVVDQMLPTLERINRRMAAQRHASAAATLTKEVQYPQADETVNVALRAAQKRHR